jgi:hypothetical protein
MPTASNGLPTAMQAKNLPSAGNPHLEKQKLSS